MSKSLKSLSLVNRGFRITTLKDFKLIQEPSVHMISSLGVGKFEILQQGSLGAAAEKLYGIFLYVFADSERY